MKLWLAGMICVAALAQPPDPAYEPLSKAFDSLRLRDYDTAIQYFEKAAGVSPRRTDIRKNLAYTLLKTGDSEGAREQFGEAMRIDPADLHVVLEYAFLCYEAKDEAPARKAEARRIFARVQDTADDDTIRATAAQAFLNIDGPLKDTIERWQHVLATSKPSFSALYELAQAAEARDALDIAATSYRSAFQLLPERKSVLLELARVEKARDNMAGAMAAWLAASRGTEPRAAELARERMPERYPYVYEFREALKLDPGNHALHRELAYLLLSMAEKDPTVREEAEHEFQSLNSEAPDDYLAAAQLGLLYLADQREADAIPLLRGVIAHADAATANRARMALHMPLVLEERTNAEAPLDARLLADRSYNAGFLKDALHYYTLAREANPFDSSIALKLGWTSNLLHDDRAALHWFGVARQSKDASISNEANRAWHNLSPSFERFRFTAWFFPVYSSRWNDLFGYGQAKEELRIGKLPFHPYASVRLVGDARRYSSGYLSQSLSESAFIAAAGIATTPWRGLMAWGEAGRAFSYLGSGNWRDYRGGITFARTIGKSLAAEKSGTFVETSADSVFVSRFNDDLINYSQTKFGYTRAAGDFRAQSFLSLNVTFDAQRQYWANFAEFGPGIRVHFPGTPAALSLTVQAVRGVYFVNDGNPRRPNFNDLRAGLWYALTR